MTTDRASFSAAIHSDIQSTSRLDHGNGHRIEYLTLWNQFDRIPQTALFRCLKSDLRAYKKEKATSFSDPVVSVSYIGYKSAPTTEEKAALASNGYTLLNMYSKDALSFAYETSATAAWVINLFRGLEKNKVELLPLNTTTIDDNAGLKGQQHPLY